jgi:hypothetical protein
MVWVGLAVILGDVHWQPKTLGIEGRSDRCPESQGAKVIRGRALAPSLRGTGPRLSVASGLNGVADVAVVSNPVARREKPRRKVMPSFPPGLGVLGSPPIRAIAGGVAPASHRPRV